MSGYFSRTVREKPRRRTRMMTLNLTQTTRFAIVYRVNGFLLSFRNYSWGFVDEKAFKMSASCVRTAPNRRRYKVFGLLPTVSRKEVMASGLKTMTLAPTWQE